MLTKCTLFAFAILALAAISVSAQGAKIPSDLQITLQRTMCFGTCPDYTLTIKANGTVTFKGGRFTKIKGTARSHITKASLRSLVRAFDRVDINSFDDDYSHGGACEGFATDMPSEIISIRRDRNTKRVNHYFGCMGSKAQEKLKPLTELAEMIDQVTNSKRWVGK